MIKFYYRDSENDYFVGCHIKHINLYVYHKCRFWSSYKIQVQLPTFIEYCHIYENIIFLSESGYRYGIRLKRSQVIPWYMRARVQWTLIEKCWRQTTNFTQRCEFMDRFVKQLLQ